MPKIVPNVFRSSHMYIIIMIGTYSGYIVYLHLSWAYSFEENNKRDRYLAIRRHFETYTCL